MQLMKLMKLNNPQIKNIIKIKIQIKPIQMGLQAIINSKNLFKNKICLMKSNA
jgi:hypothetical protein